MKYGFMARHQSVWPVRAMCRMLGVSRGGFYAWRGQAPSKRCRDNDRLTRRIRNSFPQSDRTYGAPRVWRDLRDLGEVCCENRVARLMRLASLQARPQRWRPPPTPGYGRSNVIAENLLDRQFEATAPNQRWVADFNYLWTVEGWLYLAAGIDLYSRPAASWSMSPTMTAQLVIDALMMAIWRRGKPVALLHHSDQGSQYTSENFQKLLAEQGITCSMSKCGDCWDNAAMESFFSTLKIKRIHRKRYATPEEVRADVFDYIERFYNPRRRHSTLSQISPAEFERRFAGLATCP